MALIVIKHDFLFTSQHAEINKTIFSIHKSLSKID